MRNLDDLFLCDLIGLQDTRADKDEFERYLGSVPTLIYNPKAFNPII